MSSRVILITGGSGKLGVNLIEHFLNDNNQVVFTATTESSVNKTLDKFNDKRNYLKGLVCDFNDSNFSNVILRKIEEYGLCPTDLINNARSINTLKSESNGCVSRDNFTNEYIVDVIAPYELTMALANQKNSQLRAVVNIGSQYGVVAANPNLYDDYFQESPIHYSVAKAALHHLTKELAVRLANKKIRVNCVAFGGVEGRANDDFKKRYAKLNPMQRMLTESEISSPVDFILSEKNSAMTGQVVQVDGGWSIW